MENSKPKALKGFDGARLWPVTANTKTNYTTGEKILMAGAQNLTKSTTGQDYTIYADDGVYASGSDYQYEDLTFKVAELSLEVEAKLQGSAYDSESSSYTFKNADVAPEFAFGYAAQRLDHEYRMFIHYAVKLMSVKVDHSPRPDGTDIQAYELTFRNTQRKADGAVRKVMDSDDGTYTALDTIDNIPAAPGA